MIVSLSPSNCIILQALLYASAFLLGGFSTGFTYPIPRLAIREGLKSFLFKQQRRPNNTSLQGYHFTALMWLVLVTFQWHSLLWHFNFFKQQEDISKERSLAASTAIRSMGSPTIFWISVGHPGACGITEDKGQLAAEVTILPLTSS